MANFLASSHQGKLIVERAEGEGKFRMEMSPAEAGRAKEVVGLALQMLDLDPLPDHINNTPFVIRFFAGRAYALERMDEKGSIPFRLHEGDELITVIEMALGICLNEQTQGRVVPVGTTTIPNMVSDESF